MNSPRSARRVFLRSLFVGVALLGVSHCAHAQGVTTASITGKIGDSSGAAVPETMVAVTSEETGVNRNTVSNAQGDYEVLQLPVGRYEVKAEKMGFKTAVQTGIDLVVGQQAVVNLTLSVGEVQQVVTVSEEAPLVNTTTASIAGVVGEKSVKELPLNGRSFDELITLNAGSVEVPKGPVGTGGAAQGNGNEFSVSGRHWSENLFLLNGVEYPGPSQSASLPGGVSGQLLGIDAVREFNVVSDTYGASYGHRAGAQISIATQSGTNALHGSVFEFLRNSDLDAQPFFPPFGLKFRRNQFGAAAGGPIQKDKTFVFGNYEGYRQFLGNPYQIVVPDAYARGVGSPAQGGVPWMPDICTGVYSANPNLSYKQVGGVGVGTPTTLNAAMLPIIDAYYPAPSAIGSEVMASTPSTCAGNAAFIAAGSPTSVPTGAFTGNYGAPQIIREDFGTARVDHVFSDKDTLAGIYTIDDGLNQTPEGDPTFLQDISIRAQILSFQETHIFSPRVINNFIFGYSRAAYHYQTPAVDPNFSQFFITGLAGGNFPGEIQDQQPLVQAGGSNGNNQVLYRNVWTLSDNVQVTRGRHTLNFGVWFSQLADDELAPTTQGGLVVFKTLQDLILGNANKYNVTPVQNTLYWRSLEGAWFVEDNVQVRQNLTFRIGLRHEFTNGWTEAHNNAYNNLYNPNNPSALLTSPINVPNIFSPNNEVALFSPRVGIAWDPFGKGKTSIRAGYGIYWDFNDVLGEQDLDRNAPLNPNPQFTGAFLPLIPHPPDPPQCGLPGSPAAPNCSIYSAFGVDSALKAPQVHEWNLTYEQQITPNTSFRISYVGNHGGHVFFHVDPNQIPATICGAPAGCLSGGNLSATGAKVAVIVPLGTLFVPTGPGGVAATMPNPNLGISSTASSSGKANYNGVSLEVMHRTSAGLNFKAAYTYSRELDERGSLFGAGGITRFLQYDYGPADWNDPHKFVFSGGYELPWGQKKHFMSNVAGVANQLVSGWQVNWVVSIHAGQSYTLSSGNFVANNGESGTGRPNYNPAFTGNAATSNISTSGNFNGWFNPNAFAAPTVAGTFGSVSRNNIIGPVFQSTNFSIFKNFTLTERLSLQFRTEAFNVFNQVNMNAMNLAAFSSTGTPLGNAGQFTSAFPNRQIQFGLKAIF